MTYADPFSTLLGVVACGLVSVAFLALPVVYVVGVYRRAGQQLSQWAARNGYRIIESERRRFFKGPFFWSSSNNQFIYHVTVQDAYGNLRRGWVRCGSYRLGPWVDEVDVRWDE